MARAIATANGAIYAEAVASLSPSDAKRQLREAGLRATAPRVAVLQLLAAAKAPLSHSDVVAALGTEDWDQATLYRNLLRLVDVDLARVAVEVGGVIRYEARDDKAPHRHPHFSCRTCGVVTCLPEASFAVDASSHWSHSLAESEIVLIGDCPECRKRLAGAGAKKAPRRRKGHPSP